MTYPIIVDTSHYEGLMDIDKTVSAGAAGIIAKAGEGTYRADRRVDNQFVNTIQNAKGKLVRGSYWFLSINWSIRGQAQKYAGLLANDPLEIEPYVDFEQARQFWTGVNPVLNKRGWVHLNFSHLDGFIFYFKEALKQYYPVWPWKSDIGIYTAEAYWNEYGTARDDYAKYPLWIAEPDPVLQPAPLRPWKTWKFWQYSFAEDGIKFGTDPLQAKGIDANYFNGSEEEYRKLFRLGDEPLPDPNEPPSSPTRNLKNVSVDAVRGRVTIEYTDGTWELRP